MVGGICPRPTVRAQKAASTPPAAPKRWPVIDFVELTISLQAWSLNTRLMAKVSVASFILVEVPWAHACPRRPVLPCGGSDVGGISVRCVTFHDGVNASASLLGVLDLFQHQNPRAFRENESVTFKIERPAGQSRGIVARRKRAHGSEATKTKRGDHRFARPANHHIHLAALDQPKGIADGVRTAGAGGNLAVAGALGAVLDRKLPGRQIDDVLDDEEGRDGLPGSLRLQGRVGGFERR